MRTASSVFEASWFTDSTQLHLVVNFAFTAFATPGLGAVMLLLTLMLRDLELNQVSPFL